MIFLIPGVIIILLLLFHYFVSNLTLSPRKFVPKMFSGSDVVTSRKLKILSQNVWCHYPATFFAEPHGVAKGRLFLHRLQTLAAHIAQIEYDLVLIQELFIAKIGPFTTNSNYTAFSKALAQAGLVYHTNPADSMRATRLVGQNSGVLIYSRFPLHNVQTFNFERTDERNNDKGFVVAEVHVCSSEENTADRKTTQYHTVRFVTAHLDSRSEAAKREQIRQIAKTLKEMQRTDPCDALVAGGDWNICQQVIGQGGWDDGTMYRFLCAELKSSVNAVDIPLDCAILRKLEGINDDDERNRDRRKQKNQQQQQQQQQQRRRLVGRDCENGVYETKQSSDSTVVMTEELLPHPPGLPGISTMVDTHKEHCTLDHLFIQSSFGLAPSSAKAVKFVDSNDLAVSDHLGVEVSLQI